MSAVGSLFTQYPWLALIATPIVLSFWWHRFRHGVLRLSKQRTQRLYDLTKAGKWLKADPMALQIAVVDAFREPIDDRWIRLALARHRPWRLLADCKLATNMIQIRPDGSGFMAIKPNRPRNDRAWSIAFFTLAYMPWIGLWAIAKFWTPFPMSVAAALIAACIMLTPFCLWLSMCLEAALRLVHELDKRHPRVSLPASVRTDLESPVVTLRTKERKRKGQTSKADDFALP